MKTESTKGKMWSPKAGEGHIGREREERERGERINI